MRALGIGTALTGTVTPESLAATLRDILPPAVAARVQSLALQLGADGAMVAALDPAGVDLGIRQRS